MTMKLAYTTTSPYTRRAAVTVTELGLDAQIERIAVDNVSFDSDYVRINPLMKVPALMLEDGEVLIDSTAICEYLDSLGKGPRLFMPAGPERIRQMQLQVLVNGMQEAGTQITGERVRRPEHLRWPEFIDKMLFKAKHGFDRLEGQTEFLSGRINYGVICTAVLCAFYDFRLPDFGWREGRPNLSDWYGEFSARPSMRGSEFKLPT